MTIKSESQKRLFEIYGLEMNPFPGQGSFPVDSEYEKKYAKLFIGREDAKRKIQRYLEMIESDEKVPVIFITGDYGYGKTHALKFIQYYLMEKTDKVIPIYVKNIGSPTALALYKAIIDAMYKEFRKEYIISCAKNLMQKKKALIAFVTQPFPDLEEVLPKLAEGDRSALRWLFAEKLELIEKDRLGIIREIHEDTASDALIALVRLLYYGSNIQRKFLFLIDELESVISGEPVEKVKKFYEVLRNIIDKLWGEAVFIFSATPIIVSGHLSIADLHPALKTRIKGDIIELYPLGPEETRKLIESYLEAFRKPGVREFYEKTYPFTNESIAIIHTLTKGIPRDVLRLANRIIYEAAVRRVKVIDEDFVNRVVNSVKKLEEEPEAETVEERISEDSLITISEILKERKIDEESKRRELDELEDKMYRILRQIKDKSAPLSYLARRMYVPLEVALRTARKLERKGIVVVRSRGRGHRVFLRV